LSEVSHPTQRTSVIAATLVAALGAASCAAMLHSVSGRDDAAWIVPVVWAWGLAVLALTRSAAPPLVTVVVVAIAVRAWLIGTPPLLSDDVYRYLFEGLAVRHGLDPWSHSPAELAQLDPTLAALVNHNTIPSVYPPFGMLWFALLSWLGGTVWVAQIASAAVDVMVTGLLTRRRPREGWLYALLPLPVLESASGAHIDGIAVGLALLGLTFWPRASAATWSLLVAGALTKLFPVVLLPATWSGWRQRSPGLATSAAALTVSGLIVVAALRPDQQPPDGVVAYGTSWSFNGFAWTFLEPVLGPSTRWALLATGAAVGWWTWRRRLGPAEAWVAVGSAFALLSPTMHPWYLVWAVVPALWLGDRRWAAASVPLMGSYAILWCFDPVTGRWDEAPWLWWLTWGPAVVALCLRPRLTFEER
jgi:hypothetical protein